MRWLLCRLLGHPAGVREQLRLNGGTLVLPRGRYEPTGEEVIAALFDGWFTWWTGARCVRCGERYPS